VPGTNGLLTSERRPGRRKIEEMEGVQIFDDTRSFADF